MLTDTVRVTTLEVCLREMKGLFWKGEVESSLSVMLNWLLKSG